ncbi:MAG: ester cyclase [Candidatus Bathyarchaeia archaeon]
MGAKENLELMKTLDDAWNAGPNSPLWETFKKRHKEDVKVYWPAQPNPTIGRHSHDVEATDFFKTFDNHLINNPYKIAFADETHTCTVADWTVTMKGSMKGADGKVVPPTGKTAKLEFCTVATWKNGEIVEERLFYDVVEFMQQLGLSK